MIERSYKLESVTHCGAPTLLVTKAGAGGVSYVECPRCLTQGPRDASVDAAIAGWQRGQRQKMRAVVDPEPFVATRCSHG